MYPRTTGQAALLLGTSEPRLNDLIRRRRIASPPVVSGRRLWSPDHIRKAAERLDLLTPELARLLEEEEVRDV